MKEGWVNVGETEYDVLSYVQKVYNRLEAAKDMVRGNMEKAQVKQKQWYDKRSRELQLKAKDLVLILLPTSAEKMLAKWKGPFKITRKIGRVTYEVEITEPQLRKKIFHINMLKKWHGPEPTEDTVNFITDKQEEIPCYEWEQQDANDATYGSDLTDKEKSWQWSEDFQPSPNKLPEGPA